jgi:hypothetical protein
MRPRSTSGQGTVEYIAMVALVAIVFTIAGAFTLQGRAIAAATMAQLRRGLCIVEGHDCADPHEPCSVSSHGSGDDMNVDVAIVRLSGGSFALVDHRSDGKVAVTFTDHVDGGVSVGVGGRLRIGGHPAASAELRAAFIASLGHGTSYEVNNDLQAEALIRLRGRPKVDPNFYTPAVRAYWRRVESVLPRIPTPTAQYRRFEATFSVDGKVLGGDAVLGMREDQIEGKRTYYLKGSVDLDLGVVGPKPSGEGRVALTVDRNGRPLDIEVVGSGDLNTSRDLPAEVHSVAGHVSAGAGRSWELEGQLDLTQPGRPSWRHLVTHPAELMRLIRDDGYSQFRAYGSTESDVGIEAHGKLGIGFGAGFSHMTSSQRLLTALDHTREGFWVPRYDCLAAASA